MLVIAAILVFADYHLYREVAFTPVCCVILLLVMSMLCDPPTVGLGVLVFFVAVAVALCTTSIFDFSKQADMVRVSLRLGGFILTGSLAVTLSYYRIHLQKQLADSVALFQNIPSPIIVTDDKWKIIDGNLDAAKLMGQNIAELADKNYDAFFRICMESDVEREWFGKWTHSQNDLFNTQLTVIKQNGEQIKCHAVLYKVGSGKLSKIITLLKLASG